jgi:hypothetical protein
VSGIVVGGELGCDSVPCVGEPGAHRDEHTCRPRLSAEGIRDQRGYAEDQQRQPQTCTAGLGRRSSWCKPRQQRHCHHDQDHPRTLTQVEVLAQQRPRDQQEEDETESERWLHERQGGVRQGERLQPPSAEAERRSDQPARLPDESAKQREPKRLAGRCVTRVERLQRDSEGVQSGRRGREADPGKKRNCHRAAR